MGIRFERGYAKECSEFDFTKKHIDDFLFDTIGRLYKMEEFKELHKVFMMSVTWTGMWNEGSVSIKTCYSQI